MSSISYVQTMIIIDFSILTDRNDTRFWKRIQKSKLVVLKHSHYGNNRGKISAPLIPCLQLVEPVLRLLSTVLTLT